VTVGSGQPARRAVRRGALARGRSTAPARRPALRQGSAEGAGERRAPRPEEEPCLWQRAKDGDEGARAALLLTHWPLAKAVARRYGHLPPGPEDLMQAAALGLVEAIRGYDPGRGTRFSTYAVPIILREVRQALRDALGAGGARQLFRVRAAVARARCDLAAAWEREPTVPELAEYLGIDPADVVAAAWTHAPLIGTGSALADDAVSAVDRIADPDAAGRLAHVDDRLSLTMVLASLPEPERRVLALRLLGGLTQSEVARQTGMSQSQVHRRERRGLRWVWQALSGGDGPSPDANEAGT